MQKLNLLKNKCKASISLLINPHRDYYESVIDYINGDKEDIPNDVFSEMVKQDTVIHLQFYPDTPIGSYSVYHYDLEKAVDIALETLR
jgi:hypothetical protein